MIDIRSAIGIALDFVKSTYQDQSISELRVEEFDQEKTETRSFWVITLGFDRPLPDMDELSDSMRAFLNRKTVREYKTVKVDVESGEVNSMKIRSFA